MIVNDFNRDFDIVKPDEELCAQCAEIEKQCFPDPFTAREFLNFASEETYVIITAVEKISGTAAGYICGLYVLDECQIFTVACDKQFRRRGVARALFEKLISVSSKRACPSSVYTLEVRESNLPARRLYESLGFEYTGIRENYYEMPVENACLMDLNIHLDV